MSARTLIAELADAEDRTALARRYPMLRTLSTNGRSCPFTTTDRLLRRHDRGVLSAFLGFRDGAPYLFGWLPTFSS
jgi:hypothetical protein